MGVSASAPVLGAGSNWRNVWLRFSPSWRMAAMLPHLESRVTVTLQRSANIIKTLPVVVMDIIGQILIPLLVYIDKVGIKRLQM